MVSENGKAASKSPYLSFHSYLCVGPPGAKEAIEWYKDIFGFEVVETFEDPKRKAGKDNPFVHHAHLKSGVAEIMLADDDEDYHVEGGKKPPCALKGTTFSLHITLEDPEPVFLKAITKGAKQTLELKDQDWGCKMGKFVDPFGFEWALMTPMESDNAKADAATATTADAAKTATDDAA